MHSVKTSRGGRDLILALASRYGLSSEDPCAALVVDSDLAIDDDIGDSGRELARALVGGVVVYPVRVENRDVREIALLDATAAPQPKPTCRAIGHSMNHRLQTEFSELAAKATKEPRKGPIAAGMWKAPGRSYVAADHVIGAGQQFHVVLVKLPPNRGICRRRGDVADLEILFQEDLAQRLAQGHPAPLRKITQLDALQLRSIRQIGEDDPV